jgi:hypothetical protein
MLINLNKMLAILLLLFLDGLVDFVLFVLLPRGQRLVRHHGILDLQKVRHLDFALSDSLGQQLRSNARPFGQLKAPLFLGGQFGLLLPSSPHPLLAALGGRGRRWRRRPRRRGSLFLHGASARLCHCGRVGLLRPCHRVDSRKFLNGYDFLKKRFEKWSKYSNC